MCVTKLSGIGYTVVRVPMASCDFSTRLYTYAETSGDYNLDHFTLAPEDVDMKVSFLVFYPLRSTCPPGFKLACLADPSPAAGSGCVSSASLFDGQCLERPCLDEN